MPVGMKKMNDSVNDFYAEFVSLYHLVYPDWEQSIERQAFQLESIIRENWGKDVSSVLDATCGIGTQSLGLAKRGFQVTASDISSEAVARAETEAITRELDI
jgi:tRNA/tmRNA/rRNA uracil-C5-methylase (TrmA/RlmC/RlmD family)